MSKQALKRVRKHLKMEVCRKPLDSYAWPGSYPLYYIFRDGGTCCPKCANRHIEDIDADMRGGCRWNSHGGWALAAADVNYDEELHCDHCGSQIESAYADPELDSVEGDQ